MEQPYFLQNRAEMKTFFYVFSNQKFTFKAWQRLLLWPYITAKTAPGFRIYDREIFCLALEGFTTSATLALFKNAIKTHAASIFKAIFKKDRLFCEKILSPNGSV